MSIISSIVYLPNYSSKFTGNIVIKHKFKLSQVPDDLRYWKIKLSNTLKSFKIIYPITLVGFDFWILLIRNMCPLLQIQNSFHQSVFVLNQFFCDFCWNFIRIPFFIIICPFFLFRLCFLLLLISFILLIIFCCVLAFGHLRVLFSLWKINLLRLYLKGLLHHWHDVINLLLFEPSFWIRRRMWISNIIEHLMISKRLSSFSLSDLLSFNHVSCGPA